MSISKYKIKEKAKRNKKSITLSVEKAVLDELQQEAKQKMESVNTLVNQIIKSYLQWHKPAKLSRNFCYYEKKSSQTKLRIYS